MGISLGGLIRNLFGHPTEEPNEVSAPSEQQSIAPVDVEAYKAFHAKHAAPPETTTEQSNEPIQDEAALRKQLSEISAQLQKTQQARLMAEYGMLNGSWIKYNDAPAYYSKEKYESVKDNYSTIYAHVKKITYVTRIDEELDVLSFTTDKMITIMHEDNGIFFYNEEDYDKRSHDREETFASNRYEMLEPADVSKALADYQVRIKAKIAEYEGRMRLIDNEIANANSGSV
jgi:hypothetical protein